MTRVTRAWRRLLHGEQGFSLVELLVTMAILGVVLSAITTVFVSGSKAELDMNRRFQAQQNARLAFGQLRSDIHVASCASVATAGRLLLYGTAPANMTRGNCASGTAPLAVVTTVWCAYQVATTPVVRDDLYRLSATACPATEAAAKTAGAKLESDYLTTTSLFSDPGASSGQHQSVTITLPVATGIKAGHDSYTLTDTMVLRNSPRT